MAAVRKKAVRKKAGKRGRGQPTKYKPEMCQKIVDLMAKGLSKEACAAKLNIHKDTFYEYRKKYPEFAEAIQEGEQLSLLFWEEKGIEGMLGEIPGFNPTTWIFNMKNRHGWKDKTETDITSGGKPIKNEYHIHPVKTVKNGED